MTVIKKIYDAPPVNEREILRYAGCRDADDATLTLLRDALSEAEPHLSYQLCYAEFPVEIADEFCDLGSFCIKSSSFSKNLAGCKSTVIFAATVGIRLDRLISKYSRLAPARAVMLQAIGSERVEALCDVFCNELRDELSVDIRPRFSPGYGDVSLDVQRDIFSALDISKNLSVYLTDSLLMSPSKSVTAFVGLKK